MGSSSNADNFGGQFKVIRVTQGQIHIVCLMGVKFSGWGRRPMPTILEVSSRSSGVTQGQIRIVCRMEVKLGGWRYRPMPNILEVSSRSSGSPKPYNLSYGCKTWWMGIFSDAEHFGGQFKVVRGHPGSNLYSLFYGSGTWWMALLSSDADNFEGQLKVIMGHPRSNVIFMVQICSKLTGI